MGLLNWLTRPKIREYKFDIYIFKRGVTTSPEKVQYVVESDDFQFAYDCALEFYNLSPETHIISDHQERGVCIIQASERDLQSIL